MELKIPSEYEHHECADVKCAYENGFYDGRDEAYETMIPVTDPTDFIIDLKKRSKLSYMNFVRKLDVGVNTVQSMAYGHQVAVSTWFHMIEELGYEVWLQKKEC